MIPAQEGFESSERLGLDVNDGLVVQAELLGLQCVRQLNFVVEAPDGALSERVVEYDDLCLAASFGAVHGNVGVSQERLDRTVVGGERDTDARRHGKGDIGDVKGEPQHFEEPSRDIASVVRRGDVLEQDGELVAAEPGDGIDRS